MPNSPVKFSDPLAEFVWSRTVEPMAFVSTDGKWLRVNPALCELLEYTEGELESMNFQRVTHPDDLHADLDMVKACLDGRIDWYPMVKRYITKTGKVIWIRLRADLITEEKTGKPKFFLSQMTPVESSRTISISAPPARLTMADAAKFLRDNWFWMTPVGSGVVYILYLAFLEFIDKVKAQP